MDASSGALVPGESIESSAESSSITTPSGGTGHSSVQRKVRHRQMGGPDDDKRVTMSEHSQIESEVAEESDEQSAASRSVQQFDKLSDEMKKLAGGGVEKSQEAFCQVNERQEAESRRQIAGGEETSKISSVSKQESKQSNSVADLGGGRSGTSKSTVSKSSHVSEEVCETSSSSSSARRVPDSSSSAKRLTNRSTSLQSDDLSSYRSSERLKDLRSENIQTDRTSSTKTASAEREKGGILQELQRLLDEEDKYETALRAIRRENADSSFARRSHQIRKEVDDIVANFFDRKRERRSDRSAFFDSAAKRADRLVQEFTREDDDPWRDEEERWRRQREVRQKESDDFFQNAVKKAENLVHEMRDRKESRRRDEEDIFSRYQKEIDSFFSEGRRERDLGLREREFGLSSPLRRSQDAIDDFFGTSRQSAASRRGNLRNCASAQLFADELIRDFFSDDFDSSSARRHAERNTDSWAPHRERNDSTHIDIDEVLSQASTVRDDRGARRPDIDIEELSTSTAASSRADRSRGKTTISGAGSARLVDDIVREFIADDFEDDDTLRGERPRADRQHSNTSTGTADEACSIRSEIGSRMSEATEEARATATEAHTEERRQAEEEKRKRLEEERLKLRQAEAQKVEETRSEQRIEENLSEQLQKRDSQADASTNKTANVYHDSHGDINYQRQQSGKQDASKERSSEYENSQASFQETHYIADNFDRQSSKHESTEKSEARQETCQKSEHRSSPSQDTQHSSTKVKSESYSRSFAEEAHSTKDTSTKSPDTVSAETYTATEKQQREETKSDNKSAEGDESAAAEEEKTEESSVNAEAAAAALKRAEDLLFGFVPDWEREEQKWSRVRTDRIADVGHRRKMDELLSDYQPLRHHKEDDARVRQKLERKTEEYENRIGGDVWRNLSAEPRFGRGRGGPADSVLSDLRSAREQQAQSTSSHRSQMHSRRTERDEVGTTRDREPLSADSSAATRRSKLEEYRSFKNELWDEK